MVPLLLRLDITVAEDVDSCNSALDDIGSILSWPLCIADKTDRLESQFSEGARSKRTVGSLKVRISGRGDKGE